LNLRNNQITVGEVLNNPQARALMQRQFPVLFRNQTMLRRAWNMPLNQAMNMASRYVPQNVINQTLNQLRAL